MKKTRTIVLWLLMGLALTALPAAEIDCDFEDGGFDLDFDGFDFDFDDDDYCYDCGYCDGCGGGWDFWYYEDCCW